MIMAIALILTACSAPAQSPETRFLALTGATLIDGTGADPITPSLVIICDDRVCYAGPPQAAEIPDNAEIVDLAGMTVLPGFINAHVHDALSLSNLRAWCRGGVTTVRDLGSRQERLFAFLDELPDSPELARLVAAGPLITVPGGYPIVPFQATSVLPVASDTEARERAQQLLDGGADLLKLALETGTLFGHEIPVLPPTRASLLVRIAHGRGTVVSGHITSVVDIALALDAGVDDLAHMAADRPAPAALMRRIVDHEVIWVPTLELWRCAGQERIAVNNLRSFVDAGGVVALGTDYAGYTCQWQLGMPMTEIGLMEQAGMTPMQIIVAATSNAARVCNLHRQLGTLEAGKLADLIIVPGDPLDDLSVLGQVQLVMRNGVIVHDQLTPLLSPRRPSGRRS